MEWNYDSCWQRTGLGLGSIRHGLESRPVNWPAQTAKCQTTLVRPLAYRVVGWGNGPHYWAIVYSFSVMHTSFCFEKTKKPFSTLNQPRTWTMNHGISTHDNFHKTNNLKNQYLQLLINRQQMFINFSNILYPFRFWSLPFVHTCPYLPSVCISLDFFFLKQTFSAITIS